MHIIALHEDTVTEEELTRSDDLSTYHLCLRPVDWTQLPLSYTTANGNGDV